MYPESESICFLLFVKFNSQNAALVQLYDYTNELKVIMV